MGVWWNVMWQFNPKPQVVEQRFDFRGGRNTAISPDLLNANELVDCTNARLSETYGGFVKRSGSQRIHPDAFPAPVLGITQWDAPAGKQVVVISNGDLYYRTGYDFSAPFTKVSTAGVLRSTANQDVVPNQTAGWSDPDGIDNGINTLTQAVGTNGTVAAGNRLILKFGDPAVDVNVDAVDDLYYFSFKITADGTAIGAPFGVTRSDVNLEVSTNGGGLWTATGPLFSVSASKGTTASQVANAVITVAGAPAQVWFRLGLTVTVSGPSGTGTGTIQCFNTVYKTNNYPGTWTTGAARLSLDQPSIFAAFRASISGAPLVLYIASGGHYFKWDGANLTQLDPLSGATSMLPTALIS